MKCPRHYDDELVLADGETKDIVVPIATFAGTLAASRTSAGGTFTAIVKRWLRGRNARINAPEVQLAAGATEGVWGLNLDTAARLHAYMPCDRLVIRLTGSGGGVTVNASVEVMPLRDDPCTCRGG